MRTYAHMTLYRGSRQTECLLKSICRDEEKLEQLPSNLLMTRLLKELVFPQSVGRITKKLKPLDINPVGVNQ
jgi:hypothetical protein